MVRAKFVVTKIAQHVYSQTARTITLEPRYDTSIPEDKRFAEATPSGSLEMFVNNPAAVDQFKLGQAFYLDFVPIEENSN